MNRVTFLRLVLILTLVLAACSGKQAGPARLQEVSFRVDTGLVAQRHADTALGFSFCSPKDWVLLSQELLEEAERRTARSLPTSPNARPGAVPHIICGWSDPATASVLLVSEFTGFDTRDSSSTLRGFEEYYTRSAPSADVRAAVFVSKGLKIHQLMVSDTKNVLFKMVFSSAGLRKPVQFDFAVPQAAYPQVVKTIESVAGSVAVDSTITPPN